MYADFPGRTRLTPYVGVGVGIGLTELDYGDLWARNPDPDAIGTAAGLPNEEEIRRNLAGTTTSKQAELRDKLAGYQLLVGVDHAMSKRVSLGIKARWVGFGRFAAADIEWERLRSHALVSRGPRIEAGATAAPRADTFWSRCGPGLDPGFRSGT